MKTAVMRPTNFCRPATVIHLRNNGGQVDAAKISTLRETRFALEGRQGLVTKVVEQLCKVPRNPRTRRGAAYGPGSCCCVFAKPAGWKSRTWPRHHFHEFTLGKSFIGAHLG